MKPLNFHKQLRRIRAIRPSIPSTLAAAALLALGAAGCIGIGTNDLSGERLGDGSIYDYRSSVGASAQALLSDRTFKQLVIEIQPVGDARPHTEALNQLKAFLEKHLNKPRGIGFQVNSPLKASGKATFTLDDARQIEARSRRYFTQKDRVSAYILFVDGASADDSATIQTLGQAYRNTSIIVYHATVAAHSGGENQPSRQVFEANLLMHEFGHLLGLVNLGTPSQSQHEDQSPTATPKHCADPTCLMHSSTEQVDPGSPAASATLRPLDPACHQDLQAQGGN